MRKPTKVALSLSALALLLGACKSSPAVPEIPPALTQLWKVDILSGNRPIQFGDLIIAPEMDRNYQKEVGEIAFNLKTQKIAWRRAETFYGNESFVMNDHLVYFNGVHQIVVINAEGQERSRVELPGDVPQLTFGHLIFPDAQRVGGIFILPMQQEIIAYSIDDLLSSLPDVKPVWRFDTQPLSKNGRVRLPGISCDAISTSCYLIESRDMPENQQARTELVKINATKGQEIWRKTLYSTNTTEVPRLGVINVKGDSIFVHLQGTPILTAYNQDGNEIWQNENIICPGGATDILSDLISQDGMVIVSPFGDRCYTILDAKTGVTRFVFSPPVGGSFGQIPTFVDGVMYATNGFLWAVDTKDGRTLARSTTDLPYAQAETGTVIFDPVNQQLLVWGGQLSAFKPIR